jgi:superfamily II DNA/RNA helicase
LIATDIAARGIDVVGIELVVNYDLPNNSQDYVHRIGRTARAGMAGRAISFATFEQRQDIRDIEKLIKSGLSIKQAPSLAAENSTRRWLDSVAETARPAKKTNPFGRFSKKRPNRHRRRR